jgi:hypothetical protein
VIKSKKGLTFPLGLVLNSKLSFEALEMSFVALESIFEALETSF